MLIGGFPLMFRSSGPWSFVAAGEIGVGSEAVVALPDGWQENDLLIVFASATSGNVFQTPLGGWTELFSEIGGSIAAWYKIATATESNTAIWGTTGGVDKAVMVAYRGVKIIPYDSTSALSSPGTATSVTSNSLITAEADELVITFFAARKDTSASWTAPASTNIRVNSPVEGGIRNGLLLVDENQSAAGSSVTRTANISAANPLFARSVSFKQA
jgi:hypothetical protein